MADDSEKLKALALTISQIQMPNVQHEQSVKIIENVKILLSKVVDYINEKNK